MEKKEDKGKRILRWISAFFKLTKIFFRIKHTHKLLTNDRRITIDTLIGILHVYSDYGNSFIFRVAPFQLTIVFPTRKLLKDI